MEQQNAEMPVYPMPTTVIEALGIQLIEIGRDRVVATLSIDGRHRQPFGYLHGGVSLVLAETVASVASIANIDTSRQSAFGLEINANHLRSKRDGILTARATPIHRGRSTHVWDVRITDENERLVCISRCTVAVVEQKPA